MDLSDVIAVMALVISGIALYKQLKKKTKFLKIRFSSKKYFLIF